MNLRRLGIVAMFCAPAMLVGALMHGFQRTDSTTVDPVGPYLYFVFALGWFCSMWGLQQMRATGQSSFERVIATLPLFTLPFAMLQSGFDLTGFNTSSVLYMLSDIAWPFSMLLTLIVGVTVLFTGVLKGWQRFVPLFCGLGLPVAIVFGLIWGDAAMQLSFPIHTAIGWVLLSLTIYQAAPAPKNAVAFAHWTKRCRRAFALVGQGECSCFSGANRSAKAVVTRKKPGLPRL